MKNVIRRFLSLALVLLMTLTLLPVMEIDASAATSGDLTGLSDSNIGASYTATDSGSNASWSASGNTIRGNVISINSSGCTTAYETTLTLTNNKSATATLSFDYTIDQNSGTIQVAGNAVTANGSYSGELAAGGSIKVYLKSGSTSAATSISITNLSLISDVSATTTFLPAENGSYTVDGVEITAETSKTQQSDVAYTLVATPASGYQFFGWYSVTGSKYLSSDATATLNFDTDQTIKPVFISASSPIFETGGVRFYDLNEANTYAAANGQDKIVLLSDGTLPSGAYTISGGITLAIPFDASGTLYTTTPEIIRTTSAAKAYRTLTMAEGSSITVNGAISIGGRYFAPAGNEQGRIVGDYGYIKMAANSSITVENGGALYAWGFISGSGSVLAKSGASVYEYYQIADFRGGSASTACMSDNVFPFSQYFVQNVEVPLTLNAGAKEVVYSGAYALKSTHTTSINFIGDNGMFKVTSGSFTKDYDEKTDRLIITVDGDAELNSLVLKLAGKSLDSSNFVLPITNNITININSGKVTINQDTALLAGVQVNIADGADLTVAEGKNVYLYDSDEWNSDSFVWGNCKFKSVNYAPGKMYSRTSADLKDVKMDVNGSITAIGALYTTNGGADICSGESTGKYIQMGAPGTKTETHQYNSSSENIAIPITPAKLHNADGSYTETANAQAGDTFSYKNGKWGIEVPVSEVTVTFDANGGEGTMEAQTVPASTDTALKNNAFTKEGYDFAGWNTDAEGNGTAYADGAIVNLTGSITLYAQWTKSICKHADTVIRDAKEATCTDPGYTGDTYCITCGEKIQSGEEIPAKGHTEVTDAAVEPTCTETGLTEGKHCSVCNEVLVAQKVVPAKGHTWDDGVVTKESTCAENGVMTYTCTVCNITREEPIPAKGSDWVKIDGEFYYYVDGNPLKGAQRVPYPSESILPGYGPDEEDAKVNVPGNEGNPDNYIYPDGVSAIFFFDEETGVFLKDKCGTYDDDGVTRWINNGQLIWHAGLVMDDEGNYYYFKRNGIVKNRECYVADTNGLLKAANYTFDAEGKLLKYEGLHEDLDGDLTYYVNYIRTNAGLVKDSDGNYYYIAYVDGKVKAVKNCTFRVTNTNNLKNEGFYTFDQDGKMIIKNGLVNEDDGEIYFYEDGARVYAGLVQDSEGNYYYINSSLKAVKGGTYWVTKTNDLMKPGYQRDFGSDGKMIIKNGLCEENGEIYYYENNERVFKGLVQDDDGNYYYIGSNMKAVKDGAYWVTKTNDLMKGGYQREFDADGKMIVKNGVYEATGIRGESVLVYYVNDDMQFGLGLVELTDGSYIYVNGDGTVRYVSNPNG